MARPRKNKEKREIQVEDQLEVNNEVTNESSTEKRPRGRPKKEPPANNIKNEGKKSVTMSQEEFNSQDNSYNGYNTYNNQSYTIDGLNDRFKNMFQKYANTNPQILLGAFNQAMSMLSNPFIQNMRIKQANAQSRKASKEELQKALENPANSELTLQQISFGLYYTNYFYNKMVKIDRDTPRYDWYVVPDYIDEKDVQTEAFKKESIKVDRLIKAFKPKLTFKTIATQVIIEGKSSYLPRYSMKDDGTVDFFVMQKLNTDMVKITSFGSEQMFVTSFNMMIFLNSGMYNVEQYPPFIREVWNKMLNSDMIRINDKNERVVNPKASNLPGNGTLEWRDKTWAYWVQLPQDLCYTFYTDGAHPNAFPDAIGMFDDFNDLDDYKILQQSLLSKGINSILTAEVPYVKDPKPGQDMTSTSPDVVNGFTDLFSNAVSGNVLPFFAPFQEFELHNLESQPQALDVVYSRNRDLLASTGNAALISTDSRPSVASVISARCIQEAKVSYLTKQFEEFLNNMLEKEFGLKYHWKLTLWGGIFKKDDEISQLIQGINNGFEGLIPKLLSAYEMTVEDYKASKLYMDALDVKVWKSFEIEKMKLQADLNIKAQDNQAQLNLTTTEIDNDTGNKKRGRKPLPDDQITDSTEQSRSSGQISENKQANMFSVNNSVCKNCEKLLNNSEFILCEECFEKVKEEYGE